MNRENQLLARSIQQYVLLCWFMLSTDKEKNNNVLSYRVEQTCNHWLQKHRIFPTGLNGESSSAVAGEEHILFAGQKIQMQ